MCMLTEQPPKDIGGVGRVGGEWLAESLVGRRLGGIRHSDEPRRGNYRVTETAASRAGERFTSAAGDDIPNLGSMRAPVITRGLSERTLNITAALVRKGLMAVKQLNMKGFRELR